MTGRWIRLQEKARMQLEMWQSLMILSSLIPMHGLRTPWFRVLGWTDPAGKSWVVGILKHAMLLWTMLSIIPSSKPKFLNLNWLALCSPLSVLGWNTWYPAAEPVVFMRSKPPGNRRGLWVCQGVCKKNVRYTTSIYLNKGVQGPPPPRRSKKGNKSRVLIATMTTSWWARLATCISQFFSPPNPMTTSRLHASHCRVDVAVNPGCYF